MSEQGDQAPISGNGNGNGHAGGGHAVLLLHGLCGSAAEMGTIPKALEKRGFSVASLEIPGYSASAITLGVTPDWEDWCDSVDAEIARLKHTHRTVSLCGLSMGATLALAVAARRNDILSLAVLSPLLRYDGWAMSWYVPLLKIPFLLGFRNWSYKERAPFGLRNAEMRRRVARAIEKGGVTEVGAAAIPARQLYAANKLMRYVRSALSGIESNILIIHSVDDETSAPRNAEVILHEVSSEIRKAVWLGDCYHIITFDNEREIVTNETARFIAKAAQAHEDDIGHRRSGARAPLRDRR